MTFFMHKNRFLFKRILILTIVIAMLFLSSNSYSAASASSELDLTHNSEQENTPPTGAGPRSSKTSSKVIKPKARRELRIEVLQKSILRPSPVSVENVRREVSAEPHSASVGTPSSQSTGTTRFESDAQVNEKTELKKQETINALSPDSSKVSAEPDSASVGTPSSQSTGTTRFESDAQLEARTELKKQETLADLSPDSSKVSAEPHSASVGTPSSQSTGSARFESDAQLEARTELKKQETLADLSPDSSKVSAEPDSASVGTPSSRSTGSARFETDAKVKERTELNRQETIDALSTNSPEVSAKPHSARTTTPSTGVSDAEFKPDMALEEELELVRQEVIMDESDISPTSPVLKKEDILRLLAKVALDREKHGYRGGDLRADGNLNFLEEYNKDHPEDPISEEDLRAVRFEISGSLQTPSSTRDLSDLGSVYLASEEEYSARSKSPSKSSSDSTARKLTFSTPMGSPSASPHRSPSVKSPSKQDSSHSAQLDIAHPTQDSLVDQAASVRITLSDSPHRSAFAISPSKQDSPHSAQLDIAPPTQDSLLDQAALVRITPADSPHSAQFYIAPLTQDSLVDQAASVRITLSDSTHRSAFAISPSKQDSPHSAQLDMHNKHMSTTQLGMHDLSHPVKFSTKSNSPSKLPSDSAVSNSTFSTPIGSPEGGDNVSRRASFTGESKEYSKAKSEVRHKTPNRNAGSENTTQATTPTTMSPLTTGPETPTQTQTPTTTTETPTSAPMSPLATTPETPTQAQAPTTTTKTPASTPISPLATGPETPSQAQAPTTTTKTPASTPMSPLDKAPTTRDYVGINHNEPEEDYRGSPATPPVARRIDFTYYIGEEPKQPLATILSSDRDEDVRGSVDNQIGKSSPTRAEVPLTPPTRKGISVDTTSTPVTSSKVASAVHPPAKVLASDSLAMDVNPVSSSNIVSQSTYIGGTSVSSYIPSELPTDYVKSSSGTLVTEVMQSKPSVFLRMLLSAIRSTRVFESDLGKNESSNSDEPNKTMYSETSPYFSDGYRDSFDNDILLNIHDLFDVRDELEVVKSKPEKFKSYEKELNQISRVIEKQEEKLSRQVVAQYQQPVLMHDIFSSMLRVNEMRISDFSSLAAVAAGDEIEKSYGVWSSGYLSQGKRKGGNISDMYNINQNGFAVGTDVLLDDKYILGISYSSNNISRKYSIDGENDKKTAKGSIYSIYSKYKIDENWDLSGHVQYGKMIFRSVRESGDDDPHPAFAKTKGNVFGAKIAASYTKILDNHVVVIPKIGLQYSISKVNAYKETGNGMNLEFRDPFTSTRVSLSAGVGLNKSYYLNDNIITPSISLSCEKNLKENVSKVGVFADNRDLGDIKLHSIGKDKYSTSIGGKVSFSNKSGTEFSVGYEKNLKDKFASDTYVAKIRINL
jgi:hypothetical protein